MFYDQVCGSDGEYYKSRCHLRQQACERREMLFEVPCDDGFDRSEYSEYESSGAMECIYGAAPGYDDDEDCLWEWHYPSSVIYIVVGSVNDNAMSRKHHHMPQ